MKKIKNIISVVISVMLMFSILIFSVISVFADTDTSVIDGNNISTVFKIHNYKLHDTSYPGYDSITPKNIGGISAGTANNRLFVVKSSSDLKISTFYYFDNFYEKKYGLEQKLPKRIFFPGYILGHANSMTVDDDYVYISSWRSGSDHTKRNVITRIKRQYISSVKDKAAVDPNNFKVKLNNGTLVKICDQFTVLNEDGTTYNRDISQITKYSYNKTNGITKFIITYGKGNKFRSYTIATLQNNKITVNSNNYFKVSYDLEDDEITPQDIFYDSKYGLFLLFWGYNNTTEHGSKITNYLVRYNIDSITNQNFNKDIAIDPYKTIEIKGNVKVKDKQTGKLVYKYKQYELESLAYINRNNNKVLLENPIFVFSSNNEGTNNSTGGDVDSIEKIEYKEGVQGIADLYSLF